METEANRTYTIRLPAGTLNLDGTPFVPAPGSVAAAVVSEWNRQRLRLEAVEARAGAARTSNDTSAGPVVRQVAADGDGLRVTVARPWSTEQLAALRDLERERAERAERERLAAGPSDVTVIVPVGPDGTPDLDGAGIADDAVRAAVVVALDDDLEPLAAGPFPSGAGGAEDAP